MASKISPWYINRVIDSFFRGYFFDTYGSNGYLALLIAEPYAEGEGLFWDTGHEVTYTGYARRTIAHSLAGWWGTQGSTAASSGTSGQIRPAANQFFPVCATSTQLVTHAALASTNTRETDHNEAIVYWQLDRAIQLTNVSPGFYPCLQADALTIRIDN